MVLKALERKMGEAVTVQLINIFGILGAPCILQSDNGCEFANAVVNYLRWIWPDLHIVHGKPRHSQSQGSVERANADIEAMIFT